MTDGCTVVCGIDHFWVVYEVGFRWACFRIGMN